MRIGVLLPTAALIVVNASFACDTAHIPAGTMRPDAAAPLASHSGAGGGGAGGEPYRDADVLLPRDATVDPGDASDVGGADGDDTGPRAICARNKRAFTNFLLANQGCSEDSECTMIGDCDLHADWQPINVAAATQGYTLMTERCSATSDGPTYEARCENGKCVEAERNGYCGWGLIDAGLDGG
jgi:hypothetical protein